jgi:hypothetical protein
MASSILTCGNHFARDLAEAGEPVGDVDEALVVDAGDVGGDVPAFVESFGGAFGLAEVTHHAVGAFDQQQASLVGARLRANGSSVTGFTTRAATAGSGWPPVPGCGPR